MSPLSGNGTIQMCDLFALGVVCLRCYRWLENKKASKERKN